MKQPIAIIGGMGPLASCYLYDSLITLSIQEFGAKNNDDFPEIILQSVPVPDFIANRNKKEKALKMLIKRTKALNKVDISCLSLACNTAHLLLDDLQKVSNIPFISMIDEVVSKIKRDDIQFVGILGSPVTVQSKLYQTKLKEQSIMCIVPTKRQLISLEKIIRNIIEGKNKTNDKEQLIAIAKELVMRGAQGIILGCTELPLVFPLVYKQIKIYNSVEILARALLQNYYK